MSSFVNFVSDNYVWFLVISIFLIFALIGYLVDSRRDESLLNRRKKEPSDIETMEIDIPEDKSINDTINNNSMAIEMEDNSVLSNEELK